MSIQKSPTLIVGIILLAVPHNAWQNWGDRIGNVFYGNKVCRTHQRDYERLRNENEDLRERLGHLKFILPSLKTRKLDMRTKETNLQYECRQLEDDGLNLEGQVWTFITEEQRRTGESGFNLTLQWGADRTFVTTKKLVDWILDLNDIIDENIQRWETCTNKSELFQEWREYAKSCNKLLGKDKETLLRGPRGDFGNCACARVLHENLTLVAEVRKYTNEVGDLKRCITAKLPEIRYLMFEQDTWQYMKNTLQRALNENDRKTYDGNSYAYEVDPNLQKLFEILAKFEHLVKTEQASETQLADYF